VIVAGEGEADEILRTVVRELVERGAASWAGIFFVEGDELVLGPEAGTPAPATRTQAPVTYLGARVAELAADGCGNPEFLERVADLVAEWCLVGWDTGGVPWDDAG
jgi:hypothetical protein